LDGLPKSAFALIYSLNVLEHIDDDLGTLESLKAYLKPGGTLLLYVPAFQVLYSAMDRRVGHVRRYRRSELVRLLVQAGYSVDSARYVDSLGFLAALAYRVLGSDDGSIDRRALVFFDRWIFPMSVILDRVLGRWFGKNVIVLARVKP
jgi:SAM-dependent methyltransferase